MEKIIKINEKDTLLRCSCYCQLAYKSEFNSNFLTDLTKAEMLSKEVNETDDILKKVDISEDIKAIYTQIIWAMAKDGNENIKPFTSWLRELENIDVVGIIREISEMLIKSITPDRKNV